MAGEGELLLREDYSLERDLLPRTRTEDEVTPDEWMAKPRPQKKRQSGKLVQPPLPGMPPPEPPGTARVLPMQLQIGDRMTDSTGEWEVVGRPYTTNGGKNAHVRVQRANQPGMTETKMWGAYEKVSVIRRAAAEKGKR